MVRVVLLLFLSGSFLGLNGQAYNVSQEAQVLESISPETFNRMEKKERLALLQTISDQKWSEKDSLFYGKNFNAYLKVCESQHDDLSKVWLLYRKLNVRSNLHLNIEQEEALYRMGIKEAKNANAQVELLVFNHYNEHFQFQKRYSRKPYH